MPAQKYSVLAAFAALPGLSRPADFGVGKWSRIATYGTKRQQQEDGSWRTFVFDDKSFAQGLKNFRRMFGGRGKGMGSDYEHQTLNAPLNGQPAPNLCYWSALAVINQAGKLLGLEDLRGDAAPLDPEAERARLQEQNPAEDSSPAGTWVLCGEITPLGEKLIPNYSQLSPLFNDQDTDEQGRQVGFAWQNVSFVNVAFQGRTSFNFRKSARSAMSTERGGKADAMELTPEMEEKLAAHGYVKDKPESMGTACFGYMEKTEDGPAERAAMAEACRKAGMGKMGMEQKPDSMSKLTKFGYNADKPETAETAYNAYMERTEDGPSDRAAVTAAYRKMAKGKMGAVPGESDGPGSTPAGEPSSKPPVVAAPGSMADLDKDGMAKMSKVMEPILAPLRQRVEVAEARLQDRQRLDYQTRRTAFRKSMMEGDAARFLPEQEKDLDKIIDSVSGDLDKAQEICEIMPPVAAFKRWTRGGNPEGAKTVAPPALAGLSRTQKGHAFNKKVHELRAKVPTLSYGEAQLQVAQENPDLYEGSL